MDLRVASTCQNEGPVHWLSQGLLIPLPTLQVQTADHVCEVQSHGPSLSPQRRRTWLQPKAAGAGAGTRCRTLSQGQHVSISLEKPEF